MNVLIDRLKRHAELSKPEGISYDCERAAALITELYEALRELMRQTSLRDQPSDMTREYRAARDAARAVLAKVDA